MSSSISARVAFIVGIGLLLLCGALVFGTLGIFAWNQRWVEHSERVQELLGETESDIASAARDRLIYVYNGDSASLAHYEASAAEVPVVLRKLRQITADNPLQQRNCERLEAAVNNRIQLWEKSIALKKSGAPEQAGQPEMTRQSLQDAAEIVKVTAVMASEEGALLKQRTTRARNYFLVLIALLALSFSAAILLLLWHYRLLRSELEARAGAEKSASDAAKAALESEQKAYQAERAALASHEAARRLSAHLLQVQDDERRRLSRELHDSIGQYLAAIKMTVSSLANGQTDLRYGECLKMLDQSIKEVRTISHLLHPPGLDEAGFSAAASWYVEEFAKRSGLELKLEIPELPTRLSSALELALFRVLQESLINIHRHSKSRSAEVLLEIMPEYVALSITDHGVGVPDEVLTRFKFSGTSGVGLAGMRERIRELGGRFEVESSKRGTCIRVTVPLAQSTSMPAEITAHAPEEKERAASRSR